MPRPRVSSSRLLDRSGTQAGGDSRLDWSRIAPLRHSCRGGGSRCGWQKLTWSLLLLLLLLWGARGAKSTHMLLALGACRSWRRDGWRSSEVHRLRLRLLLCIDRSTTSSSSKGGLRNLPWLGRKELLRRILQHGLHRAQAKLLLLLLLLLLLMLLQMLNQHRLQLHHPRRATLHERRHRRVAVEPALHLPHVEHGGSSAAARLAGRAVVHLANMGKYRCLYRCLLIRGVLRCCRRLRRSRRCGGLLLLLLLLLLLEAKHAEHRGHLLLQ